mgnify:CR=1 FL=1
MQVFATLGPSGSNHDYVARRYLAFHGLEGAARVELFPAFRDAFEALFSGRADYILQAAVHPDAARSVAIYRDRAPLIDTFQSTGEGSAKRYRSLGNGLPWAHPGIRRQKSNVVGRSSSIVKVMSPPQG